MNIGNRMLAIRKERQMTQEGVARLFHVTRQTVSNWETGKSYPDLQTLVQISDEFHISLDTLLKEDIQMVQKMDRYRIYKKAVVILIICVLSAAILAGIYAGACQFQHKHMYDAVYDAGFTKESTTEFIEKYQGYYALTDHGVDYLVEPKSIGKYELDSENFALIARKGNRDITIMIDENGKITLALYPGNIGIDENGNLLDKTKKLTSKQEERMNRLLTDRREELLPIISKSLELWQSINR